MLPNEGLVMELETVHLGQQIPVEVLCIHKHSLAHVIKPHNRSAVVVSPVAQLLQSVTFDA
jgi:hypothetical protein